MGVIFFISSCYVVLLRLSFSMPDPENGKTVGSVIIVPFHKIFETVLDFFLSFITLAYAFAVPQLSWFVILLQIFAPSQELSKQGCILEAAIEASATAIINLKDSLNEWDSKVGDGDCGTTVS